jgi:hypothetical protein
LSPSDTKNELDWKRKSFETKKKNGGQIKAIGVFFQYRFLFGGRVCRCKVVCVFYWEEEENVNGVK